jgi:hypothetical protein
MKRVAHKPVYYGWLSYTTWRNMFGMTAHTDSYVGFEFGPQWLGQKQEDEQRLHGVFSDFRPISLYISKDWHVSIFDKCTLQDMAYEQRQKQKAKQ